MTQDLLFITKPTVTTKEAADAGMGQEEFLLQAVKSYMKNLK
ncbi:hypothetical protein [Bacillus thuringiensis]